MGFFVFLVAALFAGAIMESIGGGFVVGILAYFQYSSREEIKSLHSKLNNIKVVKDISSTEIKEQKNYAAVDKPTSTQSSVAQPAANTSTTISESKTSTLKPKIESEPLKITTQSVKSKPQPKGPIAQFFLHGNPIARIGAVILFFGVAFALKFAADQGLFPIELRLGAAGLLSMLLLIVGWKLRQKKSQFSLILQGTGAGIFYITVFIAYRMYNFIPAPLALLFLVSITALAGLLAVVQNAAPLALLSMIGGFVAPVLASSGSGNHIALFSYLAILNIGILYMCWARAWRAINLTGFIFTFLIGSAWAIEAYQDSFYLSSQIFLAFFALLFTAINIMYSIQRRNSSTGAIDALMTFLPPLLFSILQWNLIKTVPYGTAISAALFGSVHIVLAKVLYAKFQNSMKLLVESYLIIGLVLISLSIPFAFSNEISSAIWALEAAGLVWIGIQQKHLGTRIIGLCLLPLSTTLFALDYQIDTFYHDNINLNFLGIFLLTAGFLVAGILLRNTQESTVSQDERGFGTLYLGISIVIWVLGGYVKTNFLIPELYQWFSTELFQTYASKSISFRPNVLSIFTSISVLGFWMIFHRWKVSSGSFLQNTLVIIQCILFFEFLFGKLVTSYDHFEHLSYLIGIISWPLFFITSFLILYKDDQNKPTIFNFAHTATLWLLTTFITWELCWFLSKYIYSDSSWRYACITLIPSLIVFLLCRLSKNQSFWPLNLNSGLYIKAAWLPICWSFWLCLVFNFFAAGGFDPIRYVPIINPLDLAQSLTLIALIKWSKAKSELPNQKTSLLINLIGAWLFVWATSTLLRCIHHYIGIPWEFDSFFDSNFVQASLSIFWSILALGLMLYAHKHYKRGVWKFGAILVSIVVIKLFTIDLSSQGTLSRILAFLGVGILLLGIGYAAPIPPRKTIDDNINME